MIVLSLFVEFDKIDATKSSFCRFLSKLTKTLLYGSTWQKVGTVFVTFCRFFVNFCHQLSQCLVHECLLLAVSLAFDPQTPIVEVWVLPMIASFAQMPTTLADLGRPDSWGGPLRRSLLVPILLVARILALTAALPFVVIVPLPAVEQLLAYSQEAVEWWLHYILSVQLQLLLQLVRESLVGPVIPIRVVRWHKHLGQILQDILNLSRGSR